MNNYDDLHKAFKNLIEITKIVKSVEIDEKVKTEILDKINNSFQKLESSISQIEQTGNFYKLVFDSTNDSIVTIDETGNLISANKAFYKLIATERNEFKIRITDFIIFPFKIISMKTCLEFIETHLGNEIDMDLVTGNDEIIPAKLYFNKTEVLGNKFFVCVIKDNSKNLQIQQRIINYNNQLEFLNRELELSEKALKELNASKDRFFSIISHDLKSPFTALLGLIDMLENEGNDLEEEEFKQLSTSIAKSVRKVFKLLENLLNWARVQTGAMKYVETEFDLVEVSKDSLELYSEIADDKTIKLELQTESNDILLRADKNMIQTVIRNLISNSVKFTREGGKVIVKLEETDARVDIFIIDNGMGMSSEILDNLFKIDKYNSRLGTKKEKGTGLGLILCKELIEMNNGKINVKSEPEKGSTFHIELPKK